MTGPVRRAIPGVLGFAVIVTLWQIAAEYGADARSLPAPSAILAMLASANHRSLFGRAMAATLSSMLPGYGLGAALGIGSAVLVLFLPRLHRPFDRMAAFLYALPSVATAPILILTFGREATPVALAANSTFFVIHVSMCKAFGTAPRAWGDLMSVMGSGRIRRLVSVDLPAALPALVNGLRVAVPAALLSTLVGEWFGLPRGIGVLVINAMQNAQITLLWSAVTLSVAVSLTLYGGWTLVLRGISERYR